MRLFDACFDPRKRHPVKTADAEWCQPVFVLNLPNSRSTRERADGQAERLLLAWTGLRCRHGRATEGVACGRPRVRSRPWRRSRPPAIAVGFRRPAGALVYARARSSGLRSKVGLIRRTTLLSSEAHREGHTCPRADYRSGSMRNTTCGTSTTAKARPKTTPAGRRPRPQPTRSHRPKSAPWSSRNNLVALGEQLVRVCRVMRRHAASRDDSCRMRIVERQIKM